MPANRRLSGATLLQNGKVPIAGGNGTNTTTIFDPATGQFIAGPNMNNRRYVFDAIRLNNGRVLLPGGLDNSGPGALSAVDLF